MTFFCTIGVIQVQTSLTTEPRQEKYKLKVKAVDSGLPQQSSELTVLLTVPLGNTPVEKSQVVEPVELQVTEGVDVGTEFGFFNMTDDGQVHQYRYQIAERNAGELGFIKTVVTKPGLNSFVLD